MARKLRVEWAGVCYQVIDRGNCRWELFTPKGAAASFRQCMFETAERFGWPLHAFVIMHNHFHLAERLQMDEPASVSQFVRRFRLQH